VQGPEPSVHAGGLAERPANPGRAGGPKTATLATSSTPGGRATRRRGRRQATTPGGLGATTVGRTARRYRSPREPVCSAGRSARRASPSASASPRRLTNTMGKRTSRMAQRLSPGMSVGWSHHRRGHHPQPAIAPRRLGADMARAPAVQPDPQLGRSGSHLREKLPGHVRTSWELLGPMRVHIEAR
jgi:hypothetical protein